MKFYLARGLFILGSLLFLASLGITLGHIGDPEFAQHSWYHFFREGGGLIAQLIVISAILFGPKHWKTPVTWGMLAVLLAGIFLPFWVSMPFNEVLSAPHIRAEIAHVGQAVLMTVALFLARPEFINKNT